MEDAAYFDWLYRLVCDRPSYLRLLGCLHNTEFVWRHPMDSNRAEDGVDLRYRYARENGLDAHHAAVYLDGRPCSMLEMMAALALRFEEHIMEDPAYGDRTGVWFGVMVDTLGLSGMDDAHFHEGYVRVAVQRFLSRRYGRDGSGGLFCVHGSPLDFRQMEIWYQACHYMDEIPQ